MPARRKKRPPGATTAAGYGYAHKKLSRQLRSSMANGTPCARCGRPMYKWQKIHLDHVPGDKTRYLGLAHAHCNTSSGAPYGNARRVTVTKPWFGARPW